MATITPDLLAIPSLSRFLGFANPLGSLDRGFRPLRSLPLACRHGYIDVDVPNRVRKRRGVRLPLEAWRALQDCLTQRCCPRGGLPLFDSLYYEPFVLVRCS